MSDASLSDAPRVHAPPNASGAVVTGTVAAAHIDMFLRVFVEIKASDMHLSPGVPPMFRVDGRLARMENYPALEAGHVVYFLRQMMGEEKFDHLEQRLDVDFAYQAHDIGRFRVNVFRQRSGFSVAMRIVPAVIPSFDDLRLPPVVRRLAGEPRGLVLVTGPTGSGKSTTLAAIIRHINETRASHIITIEDPIEYVHESANSLISQREIGESAESFERALRAALREDPDVILVGEMRDYETMELACRAAETGHLVFATLHTNSAASTVDRIIESFPADKQQQMRVQLSATLRGVIAQQLLVRKGGGRVAAFEILLNTPAIANMIREGKSQQIPGAIGTQRGAGMQTMDSALLELAKQGIIEKTEALESAHDVKLLAGHLDVPTLTGQLTR